MKSEKLNEYITACRKRVVNLVEKMDEEDLIHVQTYMDLFYNDKLIVSEIASALSHYNGCKDQGVNK